MSFPAESARDRFVEFVSEQLAVLGRITRRRMFGGHCLYCDGTVFALISRQTLYLKVDDDMRAAYEARGLEPFRPFEDQRMSLSYYLAPPELFEDPEAVLRWAGAAVAAGLRAAARKKRARKTPKKHP